jgi:chitin synthase
MEKTPNDTHDGPEDTIIDMPTYPSSANISRDRLSADLERIPLTDTGAYPGPYDSDLSPPSTPALHGRNGFSNEPGSRFSGAFLPVHHSNDSTSGLSGTMSPYAPSRPVSVVGSIGDWGRRQAPAGLRRFGTRRVKLQKGGAFSLEYPVPSAVSHAIQAKYRNDDIESLQNEFTHIRCMLY